MDNQQDSDSTLESFLSKMGKKLGKAPYGYFFNAVALSLSAFGQDVKVGSLRQNLGVKDPKCGNAESHGREICRQYGVKLHIIIREQEGLKYQIIDKEACSEPIKDCPDENHQEENILYIVKDGECFCPVLKNNKKPNFERVTQGKRSNPKPSQEEPPRKKVKNKESHFVFLIKDEDIEIPNSDQSRTGIFEELNKSGDEPSKESTLPDQAEKSFSLSISKTQKVGNKRVKEIKENKNRSRASSQSSNDSFAASDGVEYDLLNDSVADSNNSTVRSSRKSRNSSTASYGDRTDDNETDSGLGTSDEEGGIIFTAQEVFDFYIENEDLEGLNAFKQKLIEEECELEKKDSDTEISEDGKANSKGFWKTLLEKRIGFDIEATFKIEEEMQKPNHGRIPEMLSELMLRLAYEICLAKDIEFDPEKDEGESKKNNNPFINLDSKRIFFLLKALSPAMSLDQRRKIVELAVEEDNLPFMKCICKEHKVQGSPERVCNWTGNFSGFQTVFELLSYAMDKGAYKVATYLAIQIFSRAHPIIWDEQEKYLNNSSVSNSATRYQISVNGEMQELDWEEKVEKFKDLFLKAIEKGYSSIILIMLGGGAYNSIRVINSSYYSTNSFGKAWEIVKKGVVDFISSIKHEEFSCEGYNKAKLEALVKDNLSERVVGSITSELLLNQQHIINEIIAQMGKRLNSKKDFFKLSQSEKDMLSGIIKNLKGSNEDKISQLINRLNRANHLFSNVLLRGVLKEVIKEILEIKKEENKEKNVDVLLTACMPFWKKVIENLIKKKIKIDEKLYNTLKYLKISLDGVQLSDISELVASRDTIDNKVKAEIENLYNKKESLQQKDFKIAFSGLSRYLLRKCEKDDPLLRQAVEKIIQAIKLLSKLEQKRGMFNLYTEDVFATFFVINEKITRDDCRKIVELAVEEDNLPFIKYICIEEHKKAERGIEAIYNWEGNFSEFLTIFELLDYAIKKDAHKVATYLAMQIFSRAHPIIWVGRENYVSDSSILNSAQKYLISVDGKMQELSSEEKVEKIKGLLRKVIEKGYSEMFFIMIGGGVHRFTRVMKPSSHYYSNPLFEQAWEIVKKEVVDLISSIKHKFPNLKNYDQIALKELVESNLKKNIVSSVISELLLSQRHIIDKVVAADEKEFVLKKDFFEFSQSEKYAFDKAISNLQDKGKKGISQLFEMLNNANHLLGNVLFRKVFKKIIIDKGALNSVNKENVSILLAACMPLCEYVIKKITKDITINDKKMENVLNYIKKNKKISLEKSLLYVMKEKSKEDALKKLCGVVISLEEDDFRDFSKYEEGCSIVEQAVIDVLTSLLKVSDADKRAELEGLIKDAVEHGCNTEAKVLVRLNKDHLLV